MFDLLHELEIDFNQQYPISDPFYKKPLDIDKSAKVIKLPSDIKSKG